MASPDSPTTLDQELRRTVDDLESALAQAADAAAELRRLIPRVSAIDAMLDELDSTLHASRQRLSVGEQAPPASNHESRPRLPLATMPTTEALPDAALDPWSHIATALPPSSPAPGDERHVPDGDVRLDSASAESAGSPLLCFRLEFESRPGPLDLRTVDDAVSEHPAVHDVALLDYDGKHASLKVWIDETSSPAGVQEMLIERAREIFGADNDVTIIALEDAA
jgi:hypothetical protein